MMLRSVCRVFCGHLGLLSVSAGVSLLSLGCASDTTGPAPLDPAHLYFQLTLNHHAITLALTPPYDTIQLIATPRSATGAPIADTGTTTYQVRSELGYGSPDTNVTVSSTGVLKAVAAEDWIGVIATHTIGSLTYTDRAVINVNDISSVPWFATLALHFQPGDSARWTAWSLLGVNPILTGTALDQQGDSIANAAIAYTFSDPNFLGTIIYFTNNVGLNPYRPEHVAIAAEATVYGRSLVDTVPYTVGWPLVGLVGAFPKVPVGSHTPIGYFGPQDDTIAVGGTVVWVNELNGLPVDMIFDDPTAVQSADSTAIDNNYPLAGVYRLPNEEQGNIPAWKGVVDTIGVYGDGSPQTVTEVRARRFPTAGTYRYHSALYGTTGVVHVLPEFQIP